MPAGPPITPAVSPRNAAKQVLSPAQMDLTLFRTECDGRQTIMTLVGTAGTLSELHAYVAELGRSPLIAAAHVKGVETASTAGAAGESHFHVYVAVKPGYGQEGGPAVTPAHAQHAVSRLDDAALCILHFPEAGASP